MSLFEDIWGERQCFDLLEATDDDESLNLLNESPFVLQKEKIGEDGEDEDTAMIHFKDQPSGNMYSSFARVRRDQEASTQLILPIDTEFEESVGKIQFSTVHSTPFSQSTHKQLMVLSRNHHPWSSALQLVLLVCHHNITKIIPPMQQCRLPSTRFPIS